MSEPIIRFFIPHTDIENPEEPLVDIIGTYDALTASSFPLKTDFKCIIGIYDLDVGAHKITILYSQDDEDYGEWIFDKIQVDRPHMVVKLIVGTDELPIRSPGELDFKITIDDHIELHQRMLARLEESAHE